MTDEHLNGLGLLFVHPDTRLQCLIDEFWKWNRLLQFCQ